MSRLIVLSNRVQLPDGKPVAGGLAIALTNALSETDGVWLGWNGDIIENDFSPANQQHRDNFPTFSNLPEFATVTTSQIDYVTTAFTRTQYQHFYCGFANSVLWAMLHNRADLVTQHPDDYAMYQQVNEIFARQLQKIARPDDVIWVHDYHFLSVAYYCRQLGLTNRIGFFLHIPFAKVNVWQTLSQSEALLSHLSEYDLIGTQTQQDSQNCLTVLQHFNPDFIDVDKIKAYPIGVNVEKITEQVSNLSPRHNDVQKIIAVDRIDYSKGILERLSAYQRFLQQYPAYQTHVQLHQIAVPSRLDITTYQQLYNTVKQKIADINHEFYTENWQAIVYQEALLSHQTLMQTLYFSDICWINSLKDGMNLVAKEYIASQNPRNPGVLMLSQYAGASEQMTDAVIIDPHDPTSLQHGLLTALQMPLTQRIQRHHALQNVVKNSHIRAWRQRFLQDLATCQNS